MNMTPGEFMELQKGLNAKDIRIAQLETEVAQLKAERDLWKERALAYCGNASAAERTPGGNRFIVISQHKLRSTIDSLDDEQPEAKVVNVAGNYNDIHDNSNVNRA